MGANLKKNLQILVIAAAVLLCAGLFFVLKNYGSPAALFDSWQLAGKGYITKIVSAELLDGNKNVVADIAEKIKAKDNNWAGAEDGQFIKIVFERQLAAADDITIFARQKDLSSQPGKIEVYDGNGDLIETFFDIKQARSHKILLTKIFEATDTFYLKILGSAVELDYIFDPPEGGVTFSSGMKANSGVGIGRQFSYRKKITISTTYIDADLTNFPLLVHLSADSDVGLHTQSTGNDIMFTASDGKTVLPYERESWSGGGGSAATANFWVRVPTLDDAVDTDIYMYYGNSSAGDMSNAAAVWDTNFKGVWHLKETSGSHYDSTRNNNDSSTVSVTTQGSATGKVNGADSFNGTSNYVEMPGSSSLNITGTAITMSAWAYFTGEGTGNHFIVSKKFGDSLQFGLGRYFSTNYYPHKVFMGLYTSSWGDRVISGTTLDDNTWYYITGTYDGTYASIYINGAIDNAYGVTGSITGNSSDRTTIGCDAYATWNEFAEGTIDEVRISGSTRSAAWIKFEYHNMADSGNNLTFGSEE